MTFTNYQILPSHLKCFRLLLDSFSILQSSHRWRQSTTRRQSLHLHNHQQNRPLNPNGSLPIFKRRFLVLLSSTAITLLLLLQMDLTRNSSHNSNKTIPPVTGTTGNTLLLLSVHPHPYTIRRFTPTGFHLRKTFLQPAIIHLKQQINFIITPTCNLMYV